MISDSFDMEKKVKLLITPSSFLEKGEKSAILQ